MLLCPHSFMEVRINILSYHLFKHLSLLTQKKKKKWHGRCCTKFKAISVKFFQWDQNLYKSPRPCSQSIFPRGSNYSKALAFLIGVNHCALVGWAPSPPTSFHFSFSNSGLLSWNISPLTQWASQDVCLFFKLWKIVYFQKPNVSEKHTHQLRLWSSS